MLAQKISSNCVKVNIDLKMGTESQGYGSGSHSHSISVSLNEKLANISKVWNWSSLNLCDEIDSWLNSPRHNDSWFSSIWLGQLRMVEHVLDRVLIPIFQYVDQNDSFVLLTYWQIGKIIFKLNWSVTYIAYILWHYHAYYLNKSY